MALTNPFIVSGYVSPSYFCDREVETNLLTRNITNGRNVALISTRRMGKTGLIRHCFYQNAIKEHYYTFFIYIYSTSSLREFVFALGALVKLTKVLNCSRLMIITYSEERNIEMVGINIEIIPVWKWLLV